MFHVKHSFFFTQNYILRINNKEINAPFYVTHPGIVVCTKDEYLFKFDMINDIKDNGIFVALIHSNIDNGFIKNPKKSKKLAHIIEFLYFCGQIINR